MSQKYILGHRAQTRSMAIRYTVAVGILLILLATLQVSVFSRFRLFGVVPDLMICAVMCLAFFCGKHMGAITGIAAGFLIEAIGSAGITVLPLFYLFCGYIAGHYARTVIPRRYTAYLLYLGIALLFRCSITAFYACFTYQSINLPILFLQTILPEFLINAVAGCAMYFPMLLFCNLLQKRKS